MRAWISPIGTPRLWAAASYLSDRFKVREESGRSIAAENVLAYRPVASPPFSLSFVEKLVVALDRK